ncbi:hypothetical protein CC1G_02821 [Coprinopsis cinerea okayama7|uniref:Uncharacterized protein n=1 Tax=Coprinopsis cinerea (strain Okayama-7 / 130 / ATCC MYA-4618 / FGSC 9003) TaxID=240176 RepID=A8N052_COPC7|nr:hypothetical protein CC1G_02821 [Coprinopsis cinerea okayama7\|eukprot:XP_001828240.1 hypothetical protein CC1G_02821 [Coprinopsis cinerea okayama7\
MAIPKTFKNLLALAERRCAFHPTSQTGHSLSLMTLADILRDRSNRTGDIQDLQEAIQYYSEALHLLPTDHPSRGALLFNFSRSLTMRYYTHSKDVQDLDEAIGCLREALGLQPASDCIRGVHLSGLAATLIIRFAHGYDMEDVRAAIEIYREALRLLPTTYHTRRCVAFNALAAALAIWYGSSKDIRHLEESIGYCKEVLGLRPEDCDSEKRRVALWLMGKALFMRFGHTSDIGDLRESLVCQREALLMLPVGHPDRSESELDDIASNLARIEAGHRA